MKIKNATFETIYNRRNKLNTSGKANIDIVITHNKKRKFISTGINVKPVDWDNKARIISYNNRDAIKLNAQIDEQLQELKKIEYECLLRQTPFSLSLLDTKEKKVDQSFTKFFLSEIEKRADIKNSTRKKVKAGFNSFMDFAGDISFDELNYNLISNYDNYLRNKEYADFTIQTRHKILKTYINIAIKKDYIDANNYPYRNFKIKQGKSNRHDLSFSHLEKLEHLLLHTKSLNTAKDMFLFSCYTGLRFEDVKDIEPKHIKSLSDGAFEINKTILKTGNQIRLPISILFKGKALSLIEKHKQEDVDKIFPQPTNESVNRNLKTIAHLIEFKHNLSFHIARYTFGSRLAEVKPDPYLIMELMGHADIKTSMIYIKTSARVIEDKLKGIKW